MEMLSMQAQTNLKILLKLSRVLLNPHEVHPPSPQDLHPSSLLQKSQVKNESQKYIYPLFSLLMPTLKD
jgi:hypothetical protein